jgi:hypothetical protein
MVNCKKMVINIRMILKIFTCHVQLEKILPSMEKQWQEKAIKLIRVVLFPKLRHSTNLIQTINLGAQCSIFMIISVYKVTVLFRSNPALAVHLNTTWSSNNFTMHVSRLRGDK